jgi:hypothetical protein
MLKEPIKVGKKEKAEYPPLPKDIYQVELLDVSAEQKPTYETRNNPADQQELETVLNFQFTLLEGKDGEKDLRGRNVWANFVPTYLYQGKNGKNNLWRIVEALMGRELNAADEATLDQDFLNGLIGSQCRISVEPKQSGEKIYDRITDWLKSNKNLTKLTPEEIDTATVKNKKEKEKTEEEILDEALEGIK